MFLLSEIRFPIPDVIVMLMVLVVGGVVVSGESTLNGEGTGRAALSTHEGENVGKVAAFAVDDVDGLADLDLLAVAALGGTAGGGDAGIGLAGDSHCQSELKRSTTIFL